MTDSKVAHAWGKQATETTWLESRRFAPKSPFASIAPAAPVLDLCAKHFCCASAIAESFPSCRIPEVQFPGGTSHRFPQHPLPFSGGRQSQEGQTRQAVANRERVLQCSAGCPRLPSLPRSSRFNSVATIAAIVRVGSLHTRDPAHPARPLAGLAAASMPPRASRCRVPRKHRAFFPAQHHHRTRQSARCRAAGHRSTNFICPRRRT